MPKIRRLQRITSRRIYRDVKDVEENPMEGVCIQRSFSDYRIVYVVLKGPEGTPYEGGFFFFFVTFPINYPFGPPLARLASPDGYYNVFMNPHFFTDGTVGNCSVKGDLWSWPLWYPSKTLRDFLGQLVSLMNKEPFKGQPESNERVRYLTMKSYVCDLLESTKHQAPRIPAPLMRAMKQSFLLKYDFYISVCNEHTKKKTMWNITNPTNEELDYPTLKERIANIKKEIIRKMTNQAPQQGEGAELVLNPI